jgi:hypothetical protein
MPGKIRTLPFVALGVLLTACNISLFPTEQPTLISINGADLPGGPAGSTVVLRGGGFGDVQGSGRVLFAPSGGGVALPATVARPGDWTQAVIVATVPGGSPGNYGVYVQSGGGVTSGARLFTVTADPSFNASAITWSAGPSLPSAVSGAGVAFAQIGTAGYVYVVGGAAAGGAPVTTVSYASVAASGTLSAWMPTTALPTALEFPAAVAATQNNSAVITAGFLYVLGGATSAAGAPVATVYRAPLTANGSLGSKWDTLTATPLPTKLRSVGAAIVYGSLYVVGGATSNNALSTAVYRAPINTDGTFASVKTQTMSLAFGRARFGFGASGLYLYIFGGDNASVTPNDSVPSAAQTTTIYYAKLNPSTGDVATSWTAATTALAPARSAHSAVLGSGNVLLLGGLYSGASAHTSEATYASLNADGTVGSFTTAAPVASINSRCGCNLFNNGGSGYLAGNGTFHVLIVGGDDVSAPGTRRAETFIY